MNVSDAEQESPQGKTARESASTLSESMMPDQLNHHGNVFGGEILALVDKCGGVVARRHARHPVVTVAVDRVEFREPIYATDYVEAHGRLVYVGRSSMEVMVTVEAEQVETGKRRCTNVCFLTYVALDRFNGRPSPVPPLILETDEDRRLHAGAIRRRERRLAEEAEARAAE
ncbi:MAG TPA: acyl-CoA thioesterase [Longimicrobium sp.]|jgi:acyl-CoA hydrolase|uniref:acyl-CoA thioesterase n=1 Tax=Longimicrobium sp. TaxID=2029185 RepID=UPI002EDA1833